MKTGHVVILCLTALLFGIFSSWVFECCTVDRHVG